jgi:hypothetical protein
LWRTGAHLLLGAQDCRKPYPGGGIAGDGRSDEEGAAPHAVMSLDSGKYLLASSCGYSLESGTGRRTPPAASFPGLPEELMRIGAVIAIAADHDARNAASRPTVPVPDRSCRTRIPVRGSDEEMKASGGAVAAGRPALTRPDAAAGHPVTEQRHGRHRPFSLRAPGGACYRASARAAALGRGCRQLTPALLGVG